MDTCIGFDDSVNVRIDRSASPFYFKPGSAAVKFLLYSWNKIFKSSYIPFVVVRIIALDVVDGGDAVESANRKHHVINNFDAEITARAVHVGDTAPRVGIRVITLCVVQARNAVKAT